MLFVLGNACVVRCSTNYHTTEKTSYEKTAEKSFGLGKIVKKIIFQKFQKNKLSHAMNFPKHQRTPQTAQYSQRKLNFSLGGGALNFRTQFTLLFLFLFFVFILFLYLQYVSLG